MPETLGSSGPRPAYLFLLLGGGGWAPENRRISRGNWHLWNEGFLFHYMFCFSGKVQHGGCTNGIQDI